MPSRFFRPRRLGHANVYISAYEQALAFYRDVVGLQDGWLRPEIGGGFLNNGATHHDIGFIPWNSPVTRKKVDGPGLNHLGFEVETELDLVRGYQAAIGAGIRFTATVDHIVAHSLYNVDPDGYGTEIYADTDADYRAPEFLKLKRASTSWTPDPATATTARHYVADHRPKRFDGAVFHATKITGAVIAAADFGASYDYYTRLVGLQPVIGGRDARLAILAGTVGGRDVALFRASAALPAGLHHLRFAVFDDRDLDQSIARARAAGIGVEAEIDHPLRRACALRDPDGLRVQLVADRTVAPAQALLDLPDEQAIWLA